MATAAKVAPAVVVATTIAASAAVFPSLMHFITILFTMQFFTCTFQKRNIYLCAHNTHEHT